MTLVESPDSSTLQGPFPNCKFSSMCVSAEEVRAVRKRGTHKRGHLQAVTKIFEWLRFSRNQVNSTVKRFRATYELHPGPPVNQTMRGVSSGASSRSVSAEFWLVVLFLYIQKNSFFSSSESSYLLPLTPMYPATPSLLLSLREETIQWTPPVRLGY